MNLGEDCESRGNGNNGNGNGNNLKHLNWQQMNERATLCSRHIQTVTIHLMFIWFYLQADYHNYKMPETFKATETKGATKEVWKQSN